MDLEKDRFNSTMPGPSAAGDTPARIKRLPVDRRGYHVPKFVPWIDGQPDFRCADEAYWQQAVRQHLCWICGEPLGRWFSFVAGPMCAINRVSSEPPSHRECAEYAARTCPFLTMPKAKRPARPLPAGTKEPPGVFLEHNPTVCMVWTCSSYQLVKVANGFLVQMGEPKDVGFFREGRTASRDEILEAVNIGFPHLEREAESRGEVACAALHAQKQKFLARLAMQPE